MVVAALNGRSKSALAPLRHIKTKDENLHDFLRSKKKCLSFTLSFRGAAEAYASFRLSLVIPNEVRNLFVRGARLQDSSLHFVPLRMTWDVSF